MFQYYVDDTTAHDLYRTCQLPEPLNQSYHLVLDDLTYGYFYKSTRPLHIMYVTDKWCKAIEGNLLQYLKGICSSGILTRCDNLPYQYQADAVKLGGVFIRFSFSDCWGTDFC